MKKTIISTVTVILFIAGMVMLLLWKHKPVVVPVQAAVVAPLITHEPTMVSLNEESYLFSITGSYPQFSQVDDAVNKEIKERITHDIVDFKSSANSLYKSQLKERGDAFEQQFAESGGYYFTVQPTIIQSNDDYISFVVRTELFTGGAHPNHGIITFNYDVKNHKELLIQDIASVGFISAYTRNELKKQLLAENSADENLNAMITQGTEPDAWRFEHFTFVPKAITVYFAEYEVAPYAYGDHTVVVPLQ